jgi:hypothetical protein
MAVSADETYLRWSKDQILPVMNISLIINLTTNKQKSASKLQETWYNIFS